MTKITAILALLLAFANASANIHQDFFQDGLYDSALSSEDALAIVKAGVDSNHPNDQFLTVAALATVTMYQRFDAEGMGDWIVQLGGKGFPPTRNYGSVPGLRDFLIQYWDDHYAANGYAANYDAPVGGDDPDTMLTNPGPDLWKGVPMILTQLFPGDSAVHDLIWRINGTEGASSAETLQMMTLQWLNEGAFGTAEADAFRAGVIEDDATSGVAFVNARFAVEGLGFSRRAEAVALILQASERYPALNESVVTTLAAFSDRDLVPYASQIRPLITIPPDGSEVEAIIRAKSRLQSLTGSD